MPPISRRALLSTLAVGGVAAVTACTTPPQPPGSPQPTSANPSASPSALPFGLKVPSTVDAVIFNGAFGTDYVKLAGEQLTELYPGVRTLVTPTSNVHNSLNLRFGEGQTPPDLIDNSGGSPLKVATMVDEFLTLDELVKEPGLDGDPIGDTLYRGALGPGTFNDKLVAVNYALTVYGLWYSASTFAAEGWAVPTEWDDLLLLGEQAMTKDLHLFSWADDAASYYQELAIASAVKEGGHEVRVALDNLAENCWSHPAVTGVLEQLETCVKEGFLLHSDHYLDAQSVWSKDGKALLYPSGSWIAREMVDEMSDGFELTAAPVPTLTSSPKLPQAAVHAVPTEQFLVPKRAANPAGGLALLRVLLSRKVAEEFARTNLIPTVVRNSVPADLTSTALQSQTRMLADAGEEVFFWRFVDYYGLAAEHNALWTKFLSGEITSSILAEQLQTISDRVRNDPSVERYTAS